MPYTVFRGSFKLGRLKNTVSSSKLCEPSGKQSVLRAAHPGGQSFNEDGSSGLFPNRGG